MKSFALRMPITVQPYKHQENAFLFALKVMGYIPTNIIPKGL